MKWKDEFAVSNLNILSIGENLSMLASFQSFLTFSMCFGCYVQLVEGT